MALGANIAYGQWLDPSGTPPAGNVTTPVNIGLDFQYKQGNLRADEFHSDLYCDSAGSSCVAAGALSGGDPPRCQTISLRQYRNIQWVSSGRLLNSGERCTYADWSCGTRACAELGFALGHAGGSAFNGSGANITHLTCFKDEPITFCGNY